jgi:tRNA A-37 threonylcarbamoyl transferase component Bud32
MIPLMRSLGGPPSLDSITRDTYPAAAKFSASAIAATACGVAAAAAHLHSRGIVHGDL